MFSWMNSSIRGNSPPLSISNLFLYLEGKRLLNVLLKIVLNIFIANYKELLAMSSLSHLHFTPTALIGKLHLGSTKPAHERNWNSASDKAPALFSVLSDSSSETNGKIDLASSKTANE